MALFTVLTGLFVLAGAMLTSRYQRMRESILLRTLGASASQVLQIQLVEFFSLGLLAGLTGLLLAIGASWALAALVFHVGYSLSITPLLTGLIAVVFLAMTLGFMTRRDVSRHPPLELLRTDI